LSVFLLNYNHGHYLEERLRSVFDQSWQADEVIVIDDASTDQSGEILEAFASRYPAMRLIRNESNLGVNYNANRALRLATGDFVYPCSADDFLLPGMFEASMSLLERFPQAGICSSYHSTIDSVTGARNEYRMPWSEVPRFFTADELVSVIQGGHPSGHLMIKRAALIEAGGYLAELKWASDWFVNLVVAYRYGLCFIPQTLGWIRVEPEGYSTAGRRRWADQVEVLSHTLRHLQSPSYRDVLAYFIQGQNMTVYERHAVAAILGHSELWTPESIRLCRGAFIRTLSNDAAIDHLMQQAVPPASSPADVALPSPREFNIVLADVSRPRLDQAVEAYLGAFDEEDDVALYVLAGAKQEEVIQTNLVEVLGHLGRDPDRIPDLIVLDAPTSEVELPSYLRQADLIIASPPIAQAARDMGIPALVSPSPAELRTACDHFGMFDWKAPPPTIEDWPSERWLVTEAWEQPLASFLRRVAPNQDTALYLRVPEGQAETTQRAIADWLIAHGFDLAAIPDIVLLDHPRRLEVGIFRLATAWMDSGDPLSRAIAAALGVPKLVTMPAVPPNSSSRSFRKDTPFT